MEMYFTSGNYGKYKLNKKEELEPIFVTQEDETYFSDVNNWTIEKRGKKTYALTENMSSEDTSKIFLSIFNVMNDDFASFYNDVKSMN